MLDDFHLSAYWLQKGYQSTVSQSAVVLQGLHFRTGFEMGRFAFHEKVSTFRH